MVILKYDYDFIDVYKLTLGTGDFSNGLFHVDSFHLSSDTIPEIEKQIKAWINTIVANFWILSLCKNS